MVHRAVAFAWSPRPRGCNSWAAFRRWVVRGLRAARALPVPFMGLPEVDHTRGPGLVTVPSVAIVTAKENARREAARRRRRQYR